MEYPDRVKAVTFDVFGTVVDWRSSIARELNLLGDEKEISIDCAEFASAWRSLYQPSMSKVRSGELPYERLDVLHRRNLDKVLEQYGIDQLSEAEKVRLNQAWHRLDPWPDVIEGLVRLKGRYIIGTLSNGNVSLLANMAKNAGLPWDIVLSAELSGHYKTDPEVYIKAAELLSLPHEKIMMVAAHRGDLLAAQALGFKTAFVPRPLEYGPDRVLDTTADPRFDVNATDFMDLAAQM